MIVRRDRLHGGLVGLLVGDALGVPYEFHIPENIPPVIELDPPAGFRRSHRQVPVGTWSDDGSQALVLLGSLLDRGRFDVDDFGQRLIRWWSAAEGWVDRPFDIGNQTTTALDRLERGVDPRIAGPCEERDNGNGSLMRVLPLALWHRGTDEELIRDACLQSMPTHGHSLSQACCAVACIAARRLLDGEPSADAAFAEGERAVRRGADPAVAAEIDALEDPFLPEGKGYVLDTYHSARFALRAGPYEAAVRSAIGLGFDTDTTACVTGGLAGIRDGVDAIPARWLAGLRGEHVYRPLLERLLA